jgi:protein arginine N-methyltransferase 1
VFYTPADVTVSQGDTISGTLNCAPNKRNNRDLDISITFGVRDDPKQTFEYKMYVPIPFLLTKR